MRCIIHNERLTAQRGAPNMAAYGRHYCPKCWTEEQERCEHGFLVLGRCPVGCGEERVS